MRNVKELFVMLILITGSVLYGQSTLKLYQADLRVSGTSTLHDWEMKSTQATGTMRADVSSSQLNSISDINVNMPMKSLKSGKSGMDDKAYDAVHADKYTQARFDLTSATKSGSTWVLKGSFTFAGKKKSVSIRATESISGGMVTLKGNYTFNLTEYGIKPPTAMLGTIKTGDKVKISFVTKFK